MYESMRKSPWKILTKAPWFIPIAIIIGVLCILYGYQFLSPLASGLPAKPATNYYDSIDFLSPETKKQVQAQNHFFQQQPDKPQIMVVTVAEVDNIKEYATKLFNHWGIGDRATNNGIMILFARNSGENNVRVEVGRGMEQVISNETAKDILKFNSDNLKSHADYEVDSGLSAVFDDVSRLVDDAYGYHDSVLNYDGSKAEHPTFARTSDLELWKQQYFTWANIMLALLLIVGILWLIKVNHFYFKFHNKEQFMNESYLHFCFYAFCLAENHDPYQYMKLKDLPLFDAPISNGDSRTYGTGYYHDHSSSDFSGGFSDGGGSSDGGSSDGGGADI